MDRILPPCNFPFTWRTSVYFGPNLTEAQLREKMEVACSMLMGFFLWNTDNPDTNYLYSEMPLISRIRRPENSKFLRRTPAQTFYTVDLGPFVLCLNCSAKHFKAERSRDGGFEKYCKKGRVRFAPPQPPALLARLYAEMTPRVKISWPTRVTTIPQCRSLLAPWARTPDPRAIWGTKSRTSRDPESGR
ncbi:hypothetical protein E4U19_004545 [Claviceps sp. Clav32 group G5]|nr:hypothetical protein E4U19_004545 [Claviceps sp. Clav32 group G5]